MRTRNTVSSPDGERLVDNIRLGRVEVAFSHVSGVVRVVNRGAACVVETYTSTELEAILRRGRRPTAECEGPPDGGGP